MYKNPNKFLQTLKAKISGRAMITVTSSKDSSDGGGETFSTLDKLDVYGDGPWTVPT